MKEENPGLPTPDPQTQDNHANEVFKGFDLADGEQIIEDTLTFNPLHDFIFIEGKRYAIRSVPIFKTVQKKKGNETEIDQITAWKTFLSDGEKISVMENNKINGHKLTPLFSAREFLNNRSILLHRNDLLNPKNVSLERAYSIVKNVLTKSISISDNDLELVSCWVIAAHFVMVFPNFPPLIYGKGGFDAGGTTALTVTSLIPYPTYIFDPTEATLFRLSKYGFSLLIDEVDPDEHEKIKSLNLILDGSFSKSAQIPRATGKNFSIEGFNSYGPKAIVDPYMGIVKPSTLSRSIKLWLEHDPSKSLNLDAKEYVAMREDLIQILYGLFLRYAHKVRDAYDKVVGFTGRQRQAYGPVLAIANLVGVSEKVIRALKPSMEGVELARQGDPLKFVLFALYEYLLAEREDIDGNIGITNFTKSRDGSYISIELKLLRETLKDRVSETHQIDVGSNSNKREWKKIDPEFKKFFDANRFNQIIKDSLPDYVIQVRGNKWGLRFPNIKSKNRLQVDSVLDELERILRIEGERSYKFDRSKIAKYEQTEEAPKKDYEEEDIDDIL